MEKDWRLSREQEDYLKGKTITWKKFKSKFSKESPYYLSSHYHCEFCWHNFMEEAVGEDCSTEGYCTLDGKHWICETCYNDFKDLFEWKVV